MGTSREGRTFCPTSGSRVVTTPGAVSGSRTLRSHLVQLSIVASSSRSNGRALMEVVRSRTASGIAKDTLGTIVASQ